jgi:ferredoxin-NADP reductase
MTALGLQARAVQQEPVSELQSLLVERVTAEADDVVSLRLVKPGGGPLPAWAPGAHLDVVLPSRLVRQYSLCGDPEDLGAYRIAVLRVPQGRGGSAEMHEKAVAGCTLGIRGPRNHFALVDAEQYLFLAGGIGITPILAMARHASRSGVPWRAVYGGRSAGSMAFVDELLALPGGVVDLVPQDERGLPDLDAIVAATDPATAVYCCGPEPMIRAVEEVCGRLLPPARLHIERFASGTDAGARAPVTALAGEDTFEVELRRSGSVLAVPADRSLLAVVRDVIPGVLSSCEEGFCGACETVVLEGSPDHRDTILTEEERERCGTMMICVGRSRSPRLVLDL